MQGDDGRGGARYVDDDEMVVYRASALGRCERALVAAAQGEEAQPWPDWFQTVLDEGREKEELILQLFEEEYNRAVADQQRVVDLTVMRGVVVRGHIDGLTYEGVRPQLVEVKKFRESTWDDFLRQGVEVHQGYPWQVSAYMHALGIEDCALVGGRLDEIGEITEVEVKWLTAPPLPLKAIVKRVRELERIIGAGFSATEVRCEEADYPCPYYHLHDEKEEAEFVVLKKDASKWRPLIGQFGMLDNRIKQAKKELGELVALKDKKAEELRKMLKAMGQEADEAKVIRVKGSRVLLTRTRYERKGFEVKPTEVDYFQVKGVDNE